MDSARKAKVLKIIDSFYYHLLDSETNNVVKVELSPRPQCENYLHLLKSLADQEVTYELGKKTKMIEQYHKGRILLNGKHLSELYGESEEIKQCTEQRVYEKDQILECFILNVECLKLKLLILQEYKTITYYQSQLRLSRTETMHPKQVWQRAQDYFKDLLQGTFVQIKINGSQRYHEELNIHGEILRLHNGHDLKQKFLRDGYAELSKNCQQYLSEHRTQALNQIVTASKQQRKGIWGQGNKVKSSNNAMDQKYKQWQQWSKNHMSFKDIKNGEQQLKQIGNQLKKNSGPKPDPSKCRILVQAVISVLGDSINEKTFIQLQQFAKIVINSLTNLQTGLSLQIDSMDFLKYVNKLLILLVFYVSESQKMGTKKMMGIQLDRIVKIVFKLCFVGNQTFHEKVFDKKKESDFQKFSYDPTSLSGISSFSEQSDYEEADKLTKQAKTQKRHSSAQAKIRTNATLLLGLLFKNYSSIVQNHWEICVKPNTLTQDFLLYVQTLKITIDQEKMKPEEKKKLAALMRNNFGDHSLVMLVCFQQNSKVKANALNCMINMIGNFPDRRIIDTTEPSQVQKQLKTTKSSFVPKSFIIFSGLRNALYFLLFSLHHQKNIVIIVNTFRALTELCQQSTLVDKMGFLEGMGLLMENYINPVLQFPWNIAQLNELKSLCISFLAALVSTQKKWQQMQTEYLMSVSNKNVNFCLLKAIKCVDSLDEKIVIQILKYFTKLTKHYYSSIFYKIVGDESIWSVVSKKFMGGYQSHFGTFIEQMFKSHFDQLALVKNNSFSSSRATMETIYSAQSEFAEFLTQFLPVYGKITTNENYISLINVITYIPYQKWSDPHYQTAKQFLHFCFHSIYEEPKNQVYPSIQHLKNNSLLKLCLIKLIGYMSFCPQFQKPQYSTQAVRSLLNYSKMYKSLNSVVKITWGISNWAHIDCFKEGLAEKELKQCLDYMIAKSQSEKQKIASNCTRGIGFILRHFTEYEEMQQCTTAIVKNLSHPILKVRTNSTKTLRNILQNCKQNPKIKINELVVLLQQNILKNSYQLQTETLLLIKSLGHPISTAQMLKLYSHILHDLQNHTTLQYEFSEIKALRKLRKTILQEITLLVDDLSLNKQAANQLYNSILDFILDSKEESVRKQAENSKILDRGFERGEQALNAVFNIRKQQYDEQKTITTQFILRGLVYKANEQDIELLKNIRILAQKLVQESGQWKQIAIMEIEGCQISIGLDF